MPARVLAGRDGHAMAYDAVRQRVVLFGGRDPTFAQTPGGRLFSDTWEWDGSTWTERIVSNPPPGRYDHAMAYDVLRQRVVVFGGQNPPYYLGDTWEWDGSLWKRLMPASSPSARSASAMAYDAGRQRLVLFGGDDGYTFLHDTWHFGLPANAQPYGTACPGTNGPPVLTASVPFLGGAFALDLLSSRPGSIAAFGVAAAPQRAFPSAAAARSTWGPMPLSSSRQPDGTRR